MTCGAILSEDSQRLFGSDGGILAFLQLPGARRRPRSFSHMGHSEGLLEVFKLAVFSTSIL